MAISATPWIRITTPNHVEVADAANPDDSQRGTRRELRRDDYGGQ